MSMDHCSETGEDHFPPPSLTSPVGGGTPVIGMTTARTPNMLHRQWSLDLEGSPIPAQLSSSQAVKQKLKECLLNRKMRLALQPTSQSSSIESDCSSPGSLPYTINSAAEQAMHSYPLPSRPRKNCKLSTETGIPSQTSSFEADDPAALLRKTASEPNLFKARSSLKRRVTLHSRHSARLPPHDRKSMSQTEGMVQSPPSSLAPPLIILPTPPNNHVGMTDTWVPSTQQPMSISYTTSLPSIGGPLISPMSLGKNGQPLLIYPGFPVPLMHTPNTLSLSEQRHQRRRKMGYMREVVSEESPPLLDEPAEFNGSNNCHQEDRRTPSHPPVLLRQTLLEPPGLGRTHSTPVINLPSPIEEEGIGRVTDPALLYDPHDIEPTKTGLGYDPDMLSHRCCCPFNDNQSVHLESPCRLQAVWERLTQTSLIERCKLIRARRASQEDIQLCHTEEYSVVHGTSIGMRARLSPLLIAGATRFCHLPCGGVGLDSDTVWNDLTTAHAARLAAGQAVYLAHKVSRGHLRNGFALVRPPGHHAEANQAMGFCYFNSVAIAAKSLLRAELVSRLLIVDWDVHHGNGSQAAFLADPNVLYISLHRHDNGDFFPGTGPADEVGRTPAQGKTVNIAWETAKTSALEASASLSDAEYLAAFRHLVLPIASEFKPDLVLVSAGFDAARGHADQIGGYQVSPQAFAWMTRQLMQLAEGKVVLSLEGGYNLSSLCDCVEHCISALLAPAGDQSEARCWQIDSGELQRPPCEAAVQSMTILVHKQRPFWTCMKQLDTEDLAKSFTEGQGSLLTNQMAGLRVHNM